MAEYPAMPLWTDAYLGDTTHLTTIEHGAYLLLLMAMWRSDGVLPNDDRLLARYARLTAGQWKRVKPVLMPFFAASDDGIRQGRLTDELEAVRQHSKQQSDRARKRWKDKSLKNNEVEDATAVPRQSRGNAGSMLSTPTPIEKEEPKGSSKKGTRLPPDWLLPQDWGDWAVSEGMSPGMAAREADKFRDYWLSVSGSKGVKLDWQATWRNWVRKALDDQRRVTGQSGKPTDGDRRTTKDGREQVFADGMGWVDLVE